MLHRVGRTRETALVLLLALVLGSAGCSAAKGDVSGRVSYRGKPVVSGSVEIVGSDNRSLVGVITSDGSYTVKGLPSGEARIMVHSPDPGLGPPVRKMSGGQPANPDRGHGQPPRPAVDRRKWFPIPAKYRDPSQSDLRMTVEPGQNPHDLDLP